jgi:AbrB family looped-hinge helix DNA binding protein
MSKSVIIAVTKVYGKGRIQLPKEVRLTLEVKDGDRIYFTQDELGRIYVEKAPKIEKPVKYRVIE